MTAPLTPGSPRSGRDKQRAWWTGPRRWALLLTVAAGASALLLWDQQPEAQVQARERPVPVSAATAQTGNLSIYLEGLGTVTPLNSVTVRSRVDGELVALHFEEGQMVKAGTLLAEIDARPFQIQLEQAQAQLVRDEALLTNARQDLARYQQLLKQDAIAQQQVSTQEALVRQYEAALQGDHAQVNNARLQLEYTRITAPIDGRIGLRNVDRGNLVRAGDPNGLAVITQTQPIGVLFDIPEDDLPRVRERLRQASLPVTAFNRDQSRTLGQGQLAAVDNRINSATGMIRLKAQFPNRDEMLFPNQFVNTRLLLDTQRNALVIPDAAVQRGADGTYVWVIGSDQTVAARPVETGNRDRGLTAIHSGLKAGERVVIDGTEKLSEGKAVEVIEKSAPAGGSRTP